jgi:hypothetical protein
MQRRPRRATGSMKEIRMAARAARKIETPAAESDLEKAAVVVLDLEQRLIRAQAAVDGFAPARGQLMALFGWSTEKMAALYTKKADRKRLAAAAAPMLLPAQPENKMGSGCGTERRKLKDFKVRFSTWCPGEGQRLLRVINHIDQGAGS